MPIVGDDSHYAYDEIAFATGVDLETYSQFISVSLIDNTGERDAWEHEVSAFGVDPDTFPKKEWPPYLHSDDWNPYLKLGTELVTEWKQITGSLIWWPIEGLPDKVNPNVFLTSPGWDLRGLIDHITSMLNEPGTAVYVHCALGADRTGAVHAAWLINQQGLDAKTALDEAAQATSAGAPSADYRRLVAAYAAQR